MQTEKMKISISADIGGIVREINSDAVLGSASISLGAMIRM
jgi:hypothetical protein